jgi:hypothetical protein
MTKIVLQDLASLTNETAALAALNSNSAIIETASDNSLSRDGTAPNEMVAELDMNSHRVINLPKPIQATEPLRLQDLNDFVGGSLNITSGATQFKQLTDAPSSYSGQANKFVKVKSGENGVDFTTGDQLLAFTNLKDAPANYTGSGGLFVKVKPDVTGLEFKTAPASLTSVNYVHVKDFGAVGDGSTNDAAAIQSAIDSAFTNKYAEVRFDALEYAIGSTIIVGSGDATHISTKNGLTLVGTGRPFLRLKDGSNPGKASGTRFKWTGAASGTMVEISGPCFGNSIKNIALNCNDLAGNGLVLSSSQRGIFEGITVSDFTSNGVVLQVRTAETIAGVAEAISCADNTFRQLQVDANDAGSGTTCIALSGYTGSASNGWDSVRNEFYDTYLIVNKAGGTGVYCTFCDQNTFFNLQMSAFGVSSGTEASIRLVGTPTVPSAFPFPQNIRILGNTDIGQSLPVRIDETAGPVGGGCEVNGITLFDQQIVPRWPENKKVIFSSTEAGNFPNGGFWSEGGLTRLEKNYRNKLLNSRFDRVSNGTSFTNPGAGSNILDGWFITYDGSVTSTVKH